MSRPIRAAFVGSFSFAARETGALPRARGASFCSSGRLPCGGAGRAGRFGTGALPRGPGAGPAPSLRAAALGRRARRRGLVLLGSAVLVLAMTNFPHSQRVTIRLAQHFLCQTGTWAKDSFWRHPQDRAAKLTHHRPESGARCWSIPSLLCRPSTSDQLAWRAILIRGLLEASPVPYAQVVEY